MKINFVFLAFFLVFIPSLSFPQTNQTESLTVTTYFPSPNAVFHRMVVKKNLIVGNISDSNTAENGIDDINDIQQDQVFVTNSIILGSQYSDPTSPREGEIFFNNTSKNLEVRNNTEWQKLGP